MTALRTYAGIGSRETPKETMAVMRQIGARLAEIGFQLRSGGADGADAAFAQGAQEVAGERVIYLPWPRFNDVVDESAVVFDRLPGAPKAMQIGSQFYPRWVGAKQSVKKLMARNVMQVLGSDCMSPARFVICWATRPEFDHRGRIRDVSGGTGQAVRIAYAHGVPVFNLAVPEHEERIRRWLAAP